MKSIKHEDREKLRRALASAYFEKENADTGDLWQNKVMEHIRIIKSFYTQPSYLDRFQQLVWKLAPVAVVLALILGIMLSQVDYTRDYEIAKMFIEDPANYSLLALL
jgi:hypothetical protein